MTKGNSLELLQLASAYGAPQLRATALHVVVLAALSASDLALHVVALVALSAEDRAELDRTKQKIEARIRSARNAKASPMPTWYCNDWSPSDMTL